MEGYPAFKGKSEQEKKRGEGAPDEDMDMPEKDADAPDDKADVAVDEVHSDDEGRTCDDHSEKDEGTRKKEKEEENAEDENEEGDNKEEGEEGEEEEENGEEAGREENDEEEEVEEGARRRNGGKEDGKRSLRNKKGKKKKELSGALGLLRDLAVSASIVAIILASLYLYTGVWPPMVVIESSSMMHGKDSQIGVIDTGDLTLVKSVNDRHDIVTYVEAKDPKNPHHDYKTYGDYGDVIVYRKNGLAETPVIHRALAWIVYNASASCTTQNIFRGDIPDIGVYNVDSYTLNDVDFQHQTITIPLSTIFSSSRTSTSHAPHDGFVTHGDNNPQYVDQQVLSVQSGQRVENVKVEWIVGLAQGELPWFGIFKLWITGHSTSLFPPTSVNGLITTIVLLVAVPIAIDIIYAWMKKRKENRKTIREKIRKSQLR